MANKSGKGSSFERDFSKELSRWWTNGERDDVFWRSSNSGARATTRRKAGKSTFMQAGDIAATDPIGLPLLEIITFELKRGYSATSVADVLDKLPTAAMSQFERFIAQASEAQQANESFAWMLVTRRDRREALVWYPYRLEKLLQMLCVPKPTAIVRHEIGVICGRRLSDWFKHVNPDELVQEFTMSDLDND